MNIASPSTQNASAGRRILSRSALGFIVAGLLAACGTPSPNVNVPPSGANPSSASTPDANDVSSVKRYAPVPAEALNPDVLQNTIAQTICVPGYTASVRPSTSYTNGVKLKLLREAGIPSAEATTFELDHRVALAVGGHPRALVNLQLQKWEGEDGAKRKDQLERRLQVLVCSGQVALDEAQRAMFWDWQSALRRYGK